MEPNRSAVADPVDTDSDSNHLGADNNSDTGPGPSKRANLKANKWKGASTYKSKFQKG